MMHENRSSTWTREWDMLEPGVHAFEFILSAYSRHCCPVVLPLCCREARSDQHLVPANGSRDSRQAARWLSVDEGDETPGPEGEGCNPLRLPNLAAAVGKIPWPPSTV